MFVYNLSAKRAPHPRLRAPPRKCSLHEITGHGFRRSAGLQPGMCRPKGRRYVVHSIAGHYTRRKIARHLHIPSVTDTPESFLIRIVSTDNQESHPLERGFSARRGPATSYSGHMQLDRLGNAPVIALSDYLLGTLEPFHDVYFEPAASSSAIFRLMTAS